MLLPACTHLPPALLVTTNTQLHLTFQQALNTTINTMVSKINSKNDMMQWIHWGCMLVFIDHETLPCDSLIWVQCWRHHEEKHSKKKGRSQQQSVLILLANHDNSWARTQALCAGANHLLTKPLDQGRLKTLSQFYLQGRSDTSSEPATSPQSGDDSTRF